MVFEHSGLRPPGAAGRRAPGGRLGVASTVLGAVAVAALLWIAALSLLADFNPPDWIRVAGSMLLPVGLAGSVATGLAARRGPDRALALTGLVLSALAVAGFVVLLATAG